MSHTLTPYLVDTHCHLNLSEFGDDVTGAIERAKKADVTKMIIVGTSAEEDRKVLELTSKHEGLYPTIGFHPYYLKDLSESEIEGEMSTIEQMIKNDEVRAVGEIGLDYYYDFLDHDLQKRVFRRMLEIAKKYDKPVIIHSRDSFADVLEILNDVSEEWRGVLHCFTGGSKVALRAMKLGLHIGYTGLITYTKDRALLDSILTVPLDRILVETDAPWLTPEPYRGQKCEPAFVVETAKKIADMKMVKFEELAMMTTRNAEELFRLE